jgi:hypothetical protein
MGSACELLAETVDAAGFHAVAQQVEREVARIECKYTRYGRSGVLALLRRRAGRRVWLDAETARLIDIAAQWHERSAGLFDITGGALQRLWRFERAKRPPDATAASAHLRIPVSGGCTGTRRGSNCRRGWNSTWADCARSTRSIARTTSSPRGSTRRHWSTWAAICA